MPPRQTRARVEAKKKREIAVEALVKGYDWDAVAILAGYSSRGSACQAVNEYLRGYPVEELEEWRSLENLKLNRLEREVWKVLDAEHVVIQHGKIVGRFAGYATDPETHEVLRDNDGKPIATYDEVTDHDPALRAVAQLLRIYERRAKLNGLDAPVVIRVEDEEGLDTEIETLMGQLNQNLVSVPEGHEG